MNAGDTAAAPAQHTDQIDRGEIYDVLGYRARVKGSPAHVQLALRQVLRGFQSEGADTSAVLPQFSLGWSGAEWTVTLNDDVVHAGDDRTVALGTLEFRLIEEALDRDTGLFHLHGAALCAPFQRAGLVLAGPSGNGKTTLTLSLMLRGFTPFTDDIVLFDPATLHVNGLRRAFHLNADTWPLLEPLAGGSILTDRDMPAGYFIPAQWASEPAPIKWLLFPEYQPHQTPRLIPLSPAETAAKILGQSGTLTRAPRLALSTTNRLIQQAACFRFVTGDLAQSVAIVQRLVSES